MHSTVLSLQHRKMRAISLGINLYLLDHFQALFIICIFAEKHKCACFYMGLHCAQPLSVERDNNCLSPTSHWNQLPLLANLSLCGGKLKQLSSLLFLCLKYPESSENHATPPQANNSWSSWISFPSKSRLFYSKLQKHRLCYKVIFSFLPPIVV